MSLKKRAIEPLNHLAIQQSSAGQIALIVLTVMAVALTLGLSMSRRSVTDVSISEKEQESAKAFSAAEAGIEEALRQLKQGETDVSIVGSDLGVEEVNVNITEVGGNTEYIYPQDFVRSGESVVVWLREHNDDGTINFDAGYDSNEITVCWANEAALEITYFYQDGGSYDIRRWASDPGDNGNNFDNAAGSACSDLAHSYEISGLPGTPLFLVLKPFYNQTPLGVRGDEFPSQGYEIYSTAEVEPTSEGEKISRRIRMFKSWDIIPNALFNVIFSGTGIQGI